MLTVEIPQHCAECGHKLVAKRVHVRSEQRDRGVRGNGVLTDVIDVFLTIEVEPHFHGDTVISVTPMGAMRHRS